MSALGKNVDVGVRNGRVTRLRHPHTPFAIPGTAGATTPPSPEEVAAAYLTLVLPDYGFDPAWLTHTDLSVPYNPSPPPNDEFRITASKALAGNHVVTYGQYHLGIPIWEAGFNAQIEDSSRTAICSQSTAQTNVVIASLQAAGTAADPNARDLLAQASAADDLAKQTLQQLAANASTDITSVSSQGLLIYRYDPADSATPGPHDSHQPLPELNPGPVPASLKAGRFYVVTKLLARLKHPGWGDIDWDLFFELETNYLIHRRHTVELQTDAYGWVFETDPVRQGVADPLTGGSLNPLSDPNILDNECRSRVPLPKLEQRADGKLILKGKYVEITDYQSVDVQTIDAAQPAEDPGVDFDYSATDMTGTEPDAHKFAAVNAYYHLDSLYRMVIEEFGFTDYFTNTFGPVGAPPLSVGNGSGDAGELVPGDPGFRIMVDHRADPWQDAMHFAVAYEVNGVTRYGTILYAFGKMYPNSELGRAADAATVIHEFGHSCMRNQTGKSGFEWAHGMGDALAVILLDPASKATGEDRYLRSPFFKDSPNYSGTARRNHNQSANVDWSFRWPEPELNPYKATQVLSTILFRAYLACGGGRRQTGNPGYGLAQRRSAARYLAQRMIGAAGGCMSDGVPTETFAEYLDQLIAFDKCSEDPAGNAAGSFHKVLDWAFQEQGISILDPATNNYQWVPQRPPIDVYIDDGRNGIYSWQDNFWSSTDIWNRLLPDDGAEHQTPHVGIRNYLYVRVKNRGTQTARSVKVRAYHCRPSAGLLWPDDWQAMTTAELAADEDIPAYNNGGIEGVMVGPFQWTPTVEGHECVLAIASAEGDPANDIPGDPANVDDANGSPDTVSGPIPHWRLVPFDNNIGQRNLAPITLVPEGSTTATGDSPGAVINQLQRALQDTTFWINNPYTRNVSGIIEIYLPKFLQKRGWRVRLKHPGSEKFSLQSRKSLKVIFELEMGQPFRFQDVPERADLSFHALIEGHLIGGITYRIQGRPRSGIRRFLHRIFRISDWRYRWPR